jgi:transglutaminase-like putative cysteine protease
MKKQQLLVAGQYSFLFLLLIIVCVCSKQTLALWYLDADSVTVDIKVESGINIERQEGAYIEFITATVGFIPQETQSQTILRIDAEPKPQKIQDENYIFSWTGSKEIPTNPGFEINSRIKTKNTFYEIKKTEFPYIEFSEAIKKYTKPGEKIDSDNPKIIKKASELAAGETDYYKVVFKIAEWTKANVEYDLSTLNIKASQKASYVLAYKDGVCDEITNLFIALLRAAGIPARFVLGIAYTDAPEFPQKWGAHGWAEVYFPDTGWVPFDVTYGQFGYADPTHVKLKDSFDSSESETQYEWGAKNINVIPEPITVSAKLINQRGNIPDFLELEADAIQKQTGIGSYNVIEATIKNKKNSYASTMLFLGNVNELEIEGKNQKAVMLKPLETKREYWLVKVLDNLDSHYVYTVPIIIVDIKNTTAITEFYVRPDNTIFSKEEMLRVIKAAEEEEGDKGEYSKKIQLQCTQAKEIYYVYDSPEIECGVKNTGNFPFKNLDFCFIDDCERADLAISQEKIFKQTIKEPRTGINKIPFSIKGEDITKTEFYDLNVLDEPGIAVDNVEFPAQIEYAQDYKIAFTLKKTSSSTPKNLTLKFQSEELEKEIKLDSLESDKNFIFNLNSRGLSVKPNKFLINVSYEDLNERKYHKTEEIEIKLINVTIKQRIKIFFYDLDRGIRKIF